MKLLSIFVGFLVLVNFTNTYAQSEIKQKVHLTNIDFSLVSANLDQNRFAAQNVKVSILDVSDSTMSLRIVNDICPKVPGKFSCMAMPFPLFIGDFKLGAVTTDDCGVRHQTSDVLLQNGEIAQLEIKNFRQMTCKTPYLADMEITLKLKSEQIESESTLLVNLEKITNMPILRPPTFIFNPLAPLEFLSVGAPELNGPYFEKQDGVQAEIILNRKDKKVELTVTHNPCANSACLAISGDLIRRTLTLDSVTTNKCNEKTYTTNAVSIYDAYPAVVGAVHTYVSLEILDTRYSVCDAGQPGVTAVVKVTERQKLVQDVVLSQSTATFQLSKVPTKEHLSNVFPVK